MKPFLTEILACPIDKSYPLDVFIFKWEDPSPEILDFFKNPKPTMEGAIKAFEKNLLNTENDEDGNLLARDLIVLGKKPLPEYLHLILEKIKELEVFHDTTDSVLVHQLAKILSSVRDKIKLASDDLKKGIVPSEVILKVEMDLNLLNAYKQRVEVEEGLLRCPQCKRWYPIVETIPQMLPDNLRHQKKDLEFLAKWQARVPKDIPTEGQPWHL